MGKISPINSEKLKLKYELKVHRKAKSWPDPEDVLYEMVRFLEFQDTDIVPVSKIRDILSNDMDRLENILKILEKKKFIKRVDESGIQILNHGWK